MLLWSEELSHCRLFIDSVKQRKEIFAKAFLSAVFPKVKISVISEVYCLHFCYIIFPLCLTFNIFILVTLCNSSLVTSLITDVLGYRTVCSCWTQGLLGQ